MQIIAVAQNNNNGWRVYKSYVWVVKYQKIFVETTFQWKSKSIIVSHPLLTI